MKRNPSNQAYHWPYPTDPMEEKLFPKEEDKYKNCFSKDFWSLDEFGALMVGLSPQRYYKVLSFNGIPKDQDLHADFSRALDASWFKGKFLDYTIKESETKNSRQSKYGIVYPSCKYIQWIALKNIQMRKRFCGHLSVTQWGIFNLLQKDNLKKIAPTLTLTDKHRIQYQEKAQYIVASHPGISRDDLYNWLKPLAASFKDESGKRKKYEDRTLRNTWLAPVDIRPKGWPNKKKK
jgi:hypothetical protein